MMTFSSNHSTYLGSICKNEQFVHHKILWRYGYFGAFCGGQFREGVDIALNILCKTLIAEETGFV